jgi:hypothetical protein
MPKDLGKKKLFSTCPEVPPQAQMVFDPQK